MKKAQAQVGFAIIAMAVLLLLGGIFFDDGPSIGQKKSEYLEDKADRSSQFPTIDGFVEEDYLFYLNETEIGRQRKVTQSYPNVDLGSKEEFNTVYLGNSFRLNANPFTANTYSFDVQLGDPENAKQLLFYFDGKRSSGNQELKIGINGKLISRNLARSSDIPIRHTLKSDEKNDSVRVTFGLEKPSFFSIFNWNKMDVENLRVVEVDQNLDNNEREFTFDLDKRFLEDVIIELSVSCDEVKEIGEAIKVSVNGFIVANSNPRCLSRNNRIAANVSMNILNNGPNQLILETDGFYRVAYGVTKKYFNDQETYKFTINSFDDIIDVVMYGDFDQRRIDLRINEQTINLRRDEVKSIITYLRFGTNTIEFRDTPLEIREFVIEKNEFLG